jgi:hypothetical protein
MSALNRLPLDEQRRFKQSVVDLIRFHQRPEEIRTCARPKYDTLGRWLSLARRAETSLTRALDKLWPHLEAAMTGRSRVGWWYVLFVATLLTILVTSQFVIWYQRCFLG